MDSGLGIIRGNDLRRPERDQWLTRPFDGEDEDEQQGNAQGKIKTNGTMQYAHGSKRQDAMH